MTVTQTLIIILMCIIGTVVMRALPFLLFSSKKSTPKYIQYLGGALPGAVFAMLVVYCLKNVSPLSWPHGLPEIISICVVTLTHLWKRNVMLSIAVGTVIYMLLVQFIF